MKNSLPLPDDKKLCVIYRVEPGCLGPDGKNKIDEFCAFAQESIQSLDSDYITWCIVPRTDKTLPEMQYRAGGKKMNHLQAERYLQVFEKMLDEFEGHLVDKMASLIDSFSGH